MRINVKKIQEVLWTLTRKCINKFIHCYNGNPQRSWYQRHQAQPSDVLTCAQLNIGGMQQVDKRRRLKDLGYDIYALSETHLQQHLEQAEAHQFSEYFCLWDHNPEQRHFAGVGVLAKKSKFWDAKIIHWYSITLVTDFIRIAV